MTSPPSSRRRVAAIIGPCLLAFVEVVGTLGAARRQDAPRGLDWLAFALVLAGPLALLGLGRRPVLVLWVVVAATTTYLMLGYAYGPVLFGAAVAVFFALLSGHRLAAWTGVATLYVGHFVSRHWILDERVTSGQALGIAAWGLVILTGAEVARVRRERFLATHLARRERERLHAGEERLRIARELHDVVAHHMSLINVQAGVALHLVDRRPEQVETALTVIKDASREALGELRALVGVLRDETEAAPRAPVAMLGSLDDLVERSAVAGLRVRTRVVGDVEPLPAAVELAAFRIVQEAITNVIRHSGARTAEIRLGYSVGELTVQVDDDGSGADAVRDGAEELWRTSSGSGLRGMRERVGSLGGELTLGPAATGGWRVCAVLPIGAER